MNISGKNAFEALLIFWMMLAVSLLLMFVQNAKAKRWILFGIAISAVIFHFSNLWVDYFQTGEAKVSAAHLFILVPCHFSMYMLLTCSIMALKGKQDTRVFRWLALSFVFIGIAGYANDFQNPLKFDWVNDYAAFKQGMAHIFTSLGSLYLLTGKFIKVTPSAFAAGLFGGLLMTVICAVDYLLGLGEKDPMFLKEGGGWGRGVIVIILFEIIALQLIIGVVWEWIESKREKRKFSWQWNYLLGKQ